MITEVKTKRPPVVVVLGHVDHGKTTLLDFIRKSNVAGKETGGITQHIGAYQIDYVPTNADKDADGRGRVITFLDTPGHEAFSEMRRRGARVADIAVLVVAADESIKPQTLEAATCIAQTGIPYAVAINKIDKPNADVNRVKKDLSEHNILIEEWGGKVPALEVSAKSGKGIPELLDMLLLMWDMEEAASEEERAGEGTVIESRLDPKRGAIATVLVTSGVLKKNDAVLCGASAGKIKLLENFKGEEIDAAGAATPVRIVGLEAVPVLGDTCAVVANLEEAREAGAQAQQKLDEERKAALARIAAAASNAKKILPIILKTDVKGSEEAIIEALGKIAHDEVGLRIIESGVGDITEADIKSAESSKAVVFGFRATFPPAVEQYARQRSAQVLRHDLIYEFIEGVRKELAALLPAEVVKTSLGKARVLAIFRREKDGIIVGARVVHGNIPRGAWCDITRGDVVVSEGKIRELKVVKDTVEEVREGTEFGMLYVGKGESPQVGDSVDAYEKEERRREL